jgi:hypothetical protein
LNKENVCACFGEGNGHGLTDASRAACYEGCLTLKGEQLLYGRHVVNVVSFKLSEWCCGCV